MFELVDHMVAQPYASPTVFMVIAWSVSPGTAEIDHLPSAMTSWS